MTVREEVNQLIQQLLREHDTLPPTAIEERMAIQRRILFLMDYVKAHEFEQGYNL